MKLPRPVASAASRFCDLAFCSPSKVWRQSERGTKTGPAPGAVSVAIAHYNRGRLAHRPLCNLLDHPLVREVIFFDDGSAEEEFAALRQSISRFNSGGKIRVERRERNAGVQATKLDAVRAAGCEWVLLLDSDNTAFRSYLQALGQLTHRDPATIYCSPFAFPYFSFHELAGQRLDFARSCHLTRSGLLRRVFIINDGNYLVHRDTYIHRLAPLRSLKTDVAADVFLANYLWMSEGGSLEVLSSGTYHHRIDTSSFWMRTAEESRHRVIELFSRLEAGERWNSDFASQILL
jgi:glycosyltransferase involved in cell wall biosynthesis